MSEHHYSIDLSEADRDHIIDGLNGKRLSKARKERLINLLAHATRHDGAPLPPAYLNWAEAEKEAKKRGESVADWLYDLASRRAA